VQDLGKIEPRFGSVALLRKLSDELHRRGMRLYLDMVLNHVAFDAPLLRQKPDWFHHKGRIQNWDDPVELETHDVHGLPDLAQENDEVYRYLLETSFYWIDAVHPDGFRLDAVKHMPLDFLRRYNDDVLAHAGPGFALLGEVLEGDAHKLAGVMRKGHFTALFDFPVMFALSDVFCHDQPVAKLAAALSQDTEYERPQDLVTLLDNHDLPRILTACGADVGRVKQAMLALVTVRGTPSILYGTESGLTGEREPQNRGDMVFAPEHALRKALAFDLALRAHNRAFLSGQTRLLSAGDDLLVFARVAPTQAALVAINRGASAVSVPLPRELSGKASVRDALTGERIAGSAFSVGARAIRCLLFDGMSGPAQAAFLAATEPQRRVTFWWADAKELDPGEELIVTGSVPELGHWDPQKSRLKLDTEHGTRSDLLLDHTAVSYKLARRHKDGKIEWEPGENRYLFLTRGAGSRPAERTEIHLAWGRR
jgi:hypothetical protein